MDPSDVLHDAPVFRTGNGLTIRWLGTAGYELTAAEGDVLLIDPYVTRVGLARYLTTRIAPDRAAIGRAFGRVDGVLVGHSHFDHAMDVPVLAHTHRARVWGSQSTANLLEANGVPAAQRVVLDKHHATRFEVGPFRVTAVPSLHSRFALGNNVPYAGDIPCTCDLHLRGSQYRCGDVFSFLIDYHGYRLYHLGSANLEETAIPAAAKGVDLLLMCIAARFATERFVPRALAATTPATVMPMHYDFMWRSADKPMMLLPRTDFGRLFDDVRHFSRDIAVKTLPIVARATPPRTQPSDGHR